ncbi:MAG: GTP-binding protein [Candidatus Heimdallarchaeota archaeon]|nr:GTP-binding protein [Candidatus Heimdallarchaeota archaeon]
MFRKKKKIPISPPTTDDRTPNNYFLKLTLMGDGAVGKTNLRRNYLGVGFTQDHLMTIGADFAATEKQYTFGEKQFNVTFQIWDLAGQSTFSQVRSMYYKGCFGALMVFDLTRPSSFDNIKSWMDELKKHSGRGEIPTILLGNKYDLVDSAEQVVPREDIDKLVKELNKNSGKTGITVKYLDTSALNGLNVDTAFESMGETILRWLKVID